MKNKLNGIRTSADFIKRTRAFCLFVLLAFCMPFHGFANQAPWPGVDETVVEKYANQYGRAARKPLINTDQGDLLLFVFLLAGSAGGFIAGYSWRKLMERKDIPGAINTKGMR